MHLKFLLEKAYMFSPAVNCNKYNICNNIQNQKNAASVQAKSTQPPEVQVDKDMMVAILHQ